MSVAELQTREQLYSILAKNRNRIDDLKVENKLQAKMIGIVETNEEIIRELMEANERLNCRMEDLQTELTDIKAGLTIMKNNTMFKKIITAIQDINSEDQLEIKYSYLERLHAYWVDNAHYIRHTDSADVQTYKRSLLRHRLIDAKRNQYIANKLARYSPTLIQDLDNHLSQNSSSSQLSITEAEDAEEWWV
jgi:seryl-tRNA synthetase